MKSLFRTLDDQYERMFKKLINGNADFSKALKEYEPQVSEEMRERLDRIYGKNSRRISKKKC